MDPDPCTPWFYRCLNFCVEPTQAVSLRRIIMLYYQTLDPNRYESGSGSVLALIRHTDAFNFFAEPTPANSLRRIIMLNYQTLDSYESWSGSVSALIHHIDAFNFCVEPTINVSWRRVIMLNYPDFGIRIPMSLDLDPYQPGSVTPMLLISVLSRLPLSAWDV